MPAISQPHAVTAVHSWLASSVTSCPVLSIIGPGCAAAITGLSRRVDAIHAHPSALTKGLGPALDYGAVVIQADRLDALETTGLWALMRASAIRILLVSERVPVPAGPDAQHVALCLRSVHLE